MKIPFTGNWMLTLYSDDGSRLWLDGEVIIDNNSPPLHSLQGVYDYFDLSAGWHKIVLDYMQWTGQAGLSLWMANAALNYTNRIVPTDFFVVDK